VVTSSVWCSQWASLTGTRRRLSGITRKCPSCTGCQWYYLAALQQRQALVLDAAYCCRCSVICVPVCLSVCLSVEHNREPYKTAEPIEVIYGLRCTQETTFWVEHRILPREGALFGGGCVGTARGSILGILNVIRKAAAPACRRSINSTLVARSISDTASGYQYCSNLLFIANAEWVIVVGAVRSI